MDNHPLNVKNLEQQARRLGARALKAHCVDALRFLAETKDRYDLVFVDPPYADKLLEKSCEALYKQGFLHDGALVYVESDANIPVFPDYDIYRQGKAGRVQFSLLKARPRK